MSETENLRHNRKIELIQICNGRINSAYSPTQQMNMLIFGEDLSDLKACINAHKAVYEEHLQALAELDHEGLEAYDLHTGWPEG